MTTVVMTIGALLLAFGLGGLFYRDFVKPGQLALPRTQAVSSAESSPCREVLESRLRVAECDVAFLVEMLAAQPQSKPKSSVVINELVTQVAYTPR
jgi:hypothetical protein